MSDMNPYRLSVDESTFEASYTDFLAALWEELDDLLESHYGSRVRLDDDRLRLRLAEMRSRLIDMMDHTEPYLRDDRRPVATNVFRLRSFGAGLLHLLDFDLSDERLDLGCGTTMVLAQNRILDEARRLASPP